MKKIIDKALEISSWDFLQNIREMITLRDHNESIETLPENTWVMRNEHGDDFFIRTVWDLLYCIWGLEDEMKEFDLWGDSFHIVKDNMGEFIVVSQWVTHYFKTSNETKDFIVHTSDVDLIDPMKLIYKLKEDIFHLEWDVSDTGWKFTISEEMLHCHEDDSLNLPKIIPLGSVSHGNGDEFEIIYDVREKKFSCYMFVQIFTPECEDIYKLNEK